MKGKTQLPQVPLPLFEPVVVTGAGGVAGAEVGAGVEGVAVETALVDGGEHVLMSVSWASSQDLKCATSE